MNNCLFCKIVSGEIPSKKILDSSNVIAFEDINPQAPIHIIIIPKKHIPALTSASEDDTNILGELLIAAKKIATDLAVDSSGFRVVINNGADAGQTVSHIHLHLLAGRMLAWPPG